MYWSIAQVGDFVKPLDTVAQVCYSAARGEVPHEKSRLEESNNG